MSNHLQRRYAFEGDRSQAKHVKMGGLLRCCITTLHATTTEETEGETLSCTQCHIPMVLKDGAWQKDYYPELRERRAIAHEL